MKVYVLSGHVDYEYGVALAVFADEREAENAKTIVERTGNKKQHFDDLKITEFELGEQPYKNTNYYFA